MFATLRQTVSQAVRRTKSRFSTTASATATPSENVVVPYSGATQFLHWTMGGAVLGCFAFVNMAQQTTDKKAKMDYMFYHKSCGTLAAMLLGPRLAVKVLSKSPGPLSQGIDHYLANLGHTAMYGFLIALPVTGVSMGYFGGKGLPFFYTTLPGASNENKDGKLAGQMFKWHKSLGWYMEMNFLLHMGGVGFHMLKGQSILARILPLGAKKP